jgi:hypothetical protein
MTPGTTTTMPLVVLARAGIPPRYPGTPIIRARARGAFTAVARNTDTRGRGASTTVGPCDHPCARTRSVYAVAQNTDTRARAAVRSRKRRCGDPQNSVPARAQP